MSHEMSSQTNAATAAEICDRFDVGEEARRLLNDQLTPRQYADRLIEHEHYADAVRFVSHAMPKRHAVQWACTCTRSVLKGELSPQHANSLAAAEAWAEDPSEENRRPALPAAEAAGLDSPAGCAAAAAFFSGGSLGPPNVPPIPPEEHLTAQAVSGAVMMSTVISTPERATERYRQFLAQGIEWLGPPDGEM